MFNKPFYTAKYDIIFKRSVCVKPYEYLKRMIEKALNVKVLNILTVKTSKEDLTRSIQVRNKTLDVLAETDIGKVNIEVNTNSDDINRVRNFCYIANEYSVDTKRGEEYDNKTQFYQINLSWKIGNNKPIKSVYTVSDLNTGLKFVDNLTIIEYNMDKIDDLWYHGTEEEKEEYKEFIALNLAKDELSQICEGDAIMEEFKDKVESLNEDEDVVNFLNSKEDWEKLERYRRRKELEDNTKKVTKQTQLEIAKNFLSLNTPISDIAKATGLSLEELEKLKEKA